MEKFSVISWAYIKGVFHFEGIRWSLSWNNLAWQMSEYLFHKFQLLFEGLHIGVTTKSFFAYLL